MSDIEIIYDELEINIYLHYWNKYYYLSLCRCCISSDQINKGIVRG